MGKKEEGRLSGGEGVGGEGITLQVARFSRGVVVLCHLLVGVMNLNLNLLLVITDNVY